MRVVLFCHSIASDWNHKDAHFFRGIAAALRARGHEIEVYEPTAGWSLVHLLREHGVDPIHRLAAVYPGLDSTPFDLDRLDLDAALEGADLVLVHEWNDPELIRRVGAHHARHPSYTLFFHDTDRGAFPAPPELRDYDAALTVSDRLRDLYQRSGWANRVHLWRDAVDTHVFRPLPPPAVQDDVVWIGRSEHTDLLLEPVHTLKLSAHAYGAAYRPEAIDALVRGGITYEGWIPSFDVPAVLAAHRVAVNVPVLQALACGIPVIEPSTHTDEVVFDIGADVLIAEDAADLTKKLREVLCDAEFAAHLTSKGLATVTSRHTCEHRVDELLTLDRRLRADVLTSSAA